MGVGGCDKERWLNRHRSLFIYDFFSGTGENWKVDKYGHIPILSRLLFVTQKLFDVHPDIMGDLAQENWRDITPLVKRNRCSAAVQVPELLMTALVASF
jgi:hypothetical protein